MATLTRPTQMIILPVRPDATIEDTNSKDSQIWTAALDILEKHPGFRRVYWGRHLEEPEKTQIHVVRDTLQQHFTFLKSHEWDEFGKVLGPLLNGDFSTSTVRHAMLSEQSPNAKGLGKGAPVTGTAIYFTTDSRAWEAAWTLWTTIVPTVPGCLGVAGGWMIEPVDGHQRCYVVWVGWENTEVHDAYHHTEDFRRRGIILWQGNKGYREYGHVVFGNSRSKIEAAL